jgi:hypothetical protein
MGKLLYAEIPQAALENPPLAALRQQAATLLSEDAGVVAQFLD